MERFLKFYNEILPQISTFLGVFFIVMVVGYGFLTLIDFVPEPIDDSTTETNTSEVVDTSSDTDISNNIDFAADLTDFDTNEAMPIKISIPVLDRELTVLNPSSNTVAALDNALLSGVVRHPDSGDLQNPGNILILGHSSYLKNVFNNNYQAFNGLQNLSWGDLITLESGDAEYTYQIDRVYKAPASNVNVPTGGSEYKLTLVTCNVFGAKEDRFIVEASLISKKAI